MINILKKLTLLSLMIVGIVSSVKADTEVKVSYEPKQKMVYGMDFERMGHTWAINPEMTKKLANLAVKDCKVDYARVAIDAAAEWEEGKFDPTPYTAQLICMTALKEANPKIKFFASPRPIHEAIKHIYGKSSKEFKSSFFECFPYWIAIYEDPYSSGKKKMLKFEWQKAAEYMARHIKFLQDKGFDIAYTDLINERSRDYRPEDLSKMAEAMKKILGKNMPKIVAPSAHNWKSCDNWLSEAEKKGCLDFIDILACHNSKDMGDISMMTEWAKKLNKPLWNSELHAFQGPDDVAAEKSYQLFKHVRAGFSGINDWKSLAPMNLQHKMFRADADNLEEMKTYYIFKHLVNNTTDGNYLETSTPDGLDNTMAFIQGDKMTVWLMNPTDDDISNVNVVIEGRKALSPDISVLSWGPEDPRQGVQSKIKAKSETLFVATLKPKTLYCFTLKVK